MATPIGFPVYVWSWWPLGDHWHLGGNRCHLLKVTLEEVQEILDGYELNDLQDFITCGYLSGALLKDLAPYIAGRFRTHLNK